MNVNNKDQVYVHAYKINDDFSFIVYKDSVADMGDVILKVNEQFAGHDIKLTDMFNAESDSNWMIYLILGLIVGVVVIALIVFFIVRCVIRKKKIGQENMEPMIDSDKKKD